MTTNVKGAGRRRYEANKKHQQRTPLPPRGSKAVAEAREIVKEAAQAVVKEARAKKAATPKPERITPAQKMATAAEEAGWSVERIVKGTHKTLIATRSDGAEKIEAHWENDRSCVPLGHHTIAGRSTKFQHTTVMRKLFETDPEVAARNAVNAAQSKRGPSKNVSHRTLAKGVPFNPAIAEDEEVMAALLGHRVEWRNQMTDEFTNVAVIPLNGKTTRLEDDDLRKPETRQLTFCDADGEGFRTLRLSDLIDVSAAQVDDGLMLTVAKNRALDLRKEKGKKGA